MTKRLLTHGVSFEVLFKSGGTSLISLFRRLDGKNNSLQNCICFR